MYVFLSVGLSVFIKVLYLFNRMFPVSLVFILIISVEFVLSLLFWLAIEEKCYQNKEIK